MATAGDSYDLVAPCEAQLFRALATFIGGWAYAAAEAIDTEADFLLLLGALGELFAKWSVSLLLVGFSLTLHLSGRGELKRGMAGG